LKRQLDLLFITGHLITALYIYLLGWWSLALLPFALLVFHTGESAFAHRIFTHNSMQISKWGHFVGHLCFNACAWGSALTFGVIHNSHHRFNGTEKDPHEPKYVGKWNIFLGRLNPDFEIDRRFFRRKSGEPYAMWFHKHYFTIAWLMMPIFAPVFALSFWMRYALLVMVHDGDEGMDTSVDKWWLWPMLLGDEAHNLHHRSATTARHHRFDLVYMCMRLLKAIP
jgi:fatty-acid desaturase